MFEDLLKGLSKEMFSRNWWSEIQYLMTDINSAMSNGHYDVVLSDLDILDNDLRMVASVTPNGRDMDKILLVSQRITSIRMHIYSDIFAIPEARKFFANKYGVDNREPAFDMSTELGRRKAKAYNHSSEETIN